MASASINLERAWKSALLLINSLHELTYHQRYTLYALDLFLSTNQLPFETPNQDLSMLCILCPRSKHKSLPLFIFDILLLQIDVPIKVQQPHREALEFSALKMSLELFQHRVLITVIIADALQRVYIGYRV